MSQVKNYLSLVKFSHTIFAMPFALIGFVLGLRNHFIYQTSVDQVGFKFFLVLVCMVTARSTAMAFNRYLDRHFDKLNPRTAIREIPAGIIKAEKALVFGNEVDGVDNEVIALCDGVIEIPQWGMKHSLNISVAAAVVLWELVRS